MSSPHRTLLTLPPELRALIYPYLLQPSHCALPDPAFPALPTADEALLQREIPIPKTYTFSPAILRTCKTLHAEAAAYIATHVPLIRISTPWAQSAARIAGHGRVRLLQVGERAERADARMVVDVGMPGEDLSGRCAMLVTLDDLPSFTRFWWFSSLSFHMLNPQLALTITLIPGAGAEGVRTRLQEQLLLPFRDVRGLESFRVLGPVDKGVLERVRDGMREAFPTPESCLEECTRLKDEGNALLKETKFREAIAKYNDAHAAIFIQVNGRRRDVWGEDHFKQQLTSGQYQGQIGIMVAMLLRVKLVANTMHALIKLEEWEEARFWGERSINLMSMYMEENAPPNLGFAGGPEVGKIYYRAGLACKQLDDTDTARNYFRVALRWLPNDEIVRKEVQATTLMI